MRDWSEELNDAAAHLALMYAMPGARAHALNRLHHMERDPTWAGLIDLVPPPMAEELRRLRERRERAA
jgi:hypothetical protein